jgi:hypothetical protein
MKNPLSDLIDADAASVADLRAHIYFLRAPSRGLMALFPGQLV